MIKQFTLPAILFVIISIHSSPAYAENLASTDMFALSLEELMQIEVSVASVFLEDERLVGSSVSSITPDDWKKRGARRMHEALNNELSIYSYEVMQGGSPAIAIRGFTQKTSVRGISTTLDGVPLNSLSYATAFYQVPNWELGTLNKIEIIKGPGSAIYGSDAFHGVIALKTFESDEDHCEIEGSGAYPLYGNGNVKFSRGFYDNLIRVDMAAGKSYQGDQDLEYSYYNDTGERVSGDRKNEYDSASGVFKLSINPAEKLQLKISTYANSWKGNDFSGYGINAGSKDVSDGEDSLYMAKGQAVYTLDNNISIETAVYSWKAATANDFTAFENFSGSGSDLSIESEWTDTRSGVDLIIKQPDNDWNLQWLLAYSHTYFKIKDTFADQMLGDTEISSSPTNYEGYDRSINSVLGQLRWGAIKNRLYFLFGSRLDHYNDLGNHYTPRGGIIVLPTKRSTVKALYGRGFRAPTAGEYAGISTIKGNPELKPELLDVYELIYMFDAKTWKICLNGFYSLWKNGIATKPYTDPADAQIVEIYANVAENRSYGSEASLSFLKNAFRADIGFSYVFSEALDVEDPDNPSDTIDQQYVAFPEYSFITGLSYCLRSYDISMYLNNRVHWGMKEMHYDVSRTGNPEGLSAYWRTDFSINKIFSKSIDVSIVVQNLFNRDNYIPSIWGSKGGIKEPGISGLVRVDYKF